MAAIVGAAGLPLDTGGGARRQARAARQQGVAGVAGPLLIEAARGGGATMLPIDSEHNAIFQCMPAGLGRGRRPAA